MSADQPGTALAASVTTDKLLSEIEVGTAAEQVFSHRLFRRSTNNVTLSNLACPFGPTFVESLDQLILEGRSHPGKSTLMRGDLVELVGSSGTGKTAFLSHLIFTTLLPQSLPDFLSTPLGGRGLNVTLIQPMTHRSIIPLIRQSLRNHILNISPTTPMQMVDKVIKESLSRLTVYRPKPRWKDYALCLKKVLDNATDSPRGISSSSLEGDGDRGGLDLLVVDGMGDPHYPTKWIEEQKGNNRYYDAGYKDRILGMEDIGLKQVMECIGRIRKEVGAVVVMGTQGLRVSKESSSLFHTHLPPPYPSPFAPSSLDIKPNIKLSDLNPTYWPVNIQITFTGQLKALQFPMETTLVEVLQSRYQQRIKDNDEDQTMVYEGIVKMTQTNTGNVSTISGGKFRFGINNHGLLVQI
ncbi:hypothetical protein V865_001108 [Kwoniella europaea PYCC6329]|uniref:P-loop containing nucleoside triphosphate hydrolase protein n=1 Tax=Kwoniella europaea PYCC6329 TaxID=1423913 RepID=A0AAX4KB62_9TREE